ncbi:DUF1236 domain-containing protein [Faunimonas sp. B44]|uniref:DUF1236 domain-containing protein n=1 Tax=Faunimonas sp. B44 TaxID=3461493 RepID=UPI004044B6DA
MAALALPSMASAQTAAVAVTDLNMRAGPGPNYPVVGVIGANGAVSIAGCIENSKWCQVTAGGNSGWAYSDYLAADAGGQQVVVTQRTPQMNVPSVTYEARSGGSEGAAMTAAGGAVAGALIAGPVGALVGGFTGAVAGAAVDPPQEVRTYVTQNQVEPVYLEGEVVVGARVPETVELRPVPDYEYSYAYVNGQPVLVRPQEREIVYVVR